MMGEGNRLKHNRKNDAEKRGNERKKEIKKTLKKVGVIAGGLLLVGTLAKCTSDNGNNSNDTNTDTDVPANFCDKIESSRANLQVVPGMGYDTEYESRRCSDEDGCKMGVNEGDAITVVNPTGIQEQWFVESVDNERVVLKDLLTDRTMDIEVGGATFIDVVEDPESGEPTYTTHIMDVYLLGACSIGTTCEEGGVTTDIVNSIGKAIVAVSANGETKRVMLSDEEGATVSVGGYNVTLTMNKVTEGNFNIVYRVGDSDEKAELGEPVAEGEAHAVNDELSIANEVSSDSATTACSTVMAVLKVTDTDHVDEEGEPIPYEVEIEDGGTVTIGGKTYQLSVLAKIADGSVRPFEQVNLNKSGVEFMDLNTGESEVRYKNQTLDLGGGKTVQVGAINVYYPPGY